MNEMVPLVDAEWLRNELERTGRTQRALAQHLGLDPSAVSRLLDGRRKLKADEANRAKEFFGLNDIGSDTMPFNEGRAISRNLSAAGAIQRRNRPADTFKSMPLFGNVISKGDCGYLFENKVTEYRECPPQLNGVEGAFAICIPDNKLGPRYRRGEVIYVHPSRPLKIGMYVIVTAPETVKENWRHGGSWLDYNSKQSDHNTGKIIAISAAIGEVIDFHPRGIILRNCARNTSKPVMLNTHGLFSCANVGCILVSAIE